MLIIKTFPLKVAGVPCVSVKRNETEKKREEGRLKLLFQFYHQ